MKYTLFFISLLMFTTAAQAGIYLEPYGGFGVGTIKEDAVITKPAAKAGNVHTNDNIAGGYYGGKLGFSFLGVAFGGDYMGTSFGNYKDSDIGAFVQLSLPILLKFSGTYFFKATQEEPNHTVSGTGFKLGVGFDFLPFLSLNFDYVNTTYTDISDSVYTYSSFSGQKNAYMIGLSIPL